MNPVLLRQCLGFAVSAVLAAYSLTAYEVARAAEPETLQEATSTAAIPDDVINGFLFRIDDSLGDKVRALGANPPAELRIPVLLGVEPDEIEDTWGDARSGGRVHEGADIIAPRGELVVSPTGAVVTNVGYDRSGGNYVITANPGGEQFYYAHLDGVAANIAPGSVLTPADLVGYVGNTGNARQKAPHLHFGVYYKGRATNPHPRLVQALSLEERLAALEKILDTSDTAFSLAIRLAERHEGLFKEAQSRGLAVPQQIVLVLQNDEIVAKARILERALAPGTEGAAVRALQEFLIAESAGSGARALAKKGATGHFGALTQNALAEYQAATGIAPARGYFGPVTRAKVLESLARTAAKVSREAKAAPWAASVDRDLAIGSAGKEVERLQQFLIKANAGSAAQALAKEGATGYFGALTRSALAEYQRAAGIAPARGYFGPVTRAQLQSAGVQISL